MIRNVIMQHNHYIIFIHDKYCDFYNEIENNYEINFK